MNKTIVKANEAPAAIGPYSQAVRAGDFVYTSGQIPLDARTGEVRGTSVAEQTEQVLINLAAVLRAAGSSLADAVKVNVYLTNLADFAAMNEVYARHFKDAPPARACVEVSRLPKGVLVEIDAVAVARG